MSRHVLGIYAEKGNGQSWDGHRRPRRQRLDSSSRLSNSMATKKDEESGLSTYYNNKTTVIQEARVFNESPISPRKCRALLTRLVYLLYVGESFNTQEATTLFFGTTKLFQHKDVSLIRMFVYEGFDWIGGVGRVTTSGLPCDQGVGYDGGGCYHGHKQYNEGYATQLGSNLST